MAHTDGRRRRAADRLSRLLGSRLRLPALVLGAALVYGTAGFRVVEGFGLVDSLYMTVITLTTVGFGEVRPLGTGGRLFTISLIVVGMVGALSVLGAVTATLASGELGTILKRRGMRKRIDGLHDHYVICAYGRVGRAAAEELVRQGADVVAIEVRPDLEPLLAESGIAYLIGDPTSEAVLEEARIRQAKALICAVDSDAVNVYITLAARALNPALFIISRASSAGSVETLRRAGSDRVVSPYSLSGLRMAALSQQPAMLDFVDIVSVAPDLRVEELVVGPASALAGRTVREACAPHGGVMMLVVITSGGETVIPPRADTVLGAGDLVIAIGRAPTLARLAAAAR